MTRLRIFERKNLSKRLREWLKRVRADAPQYPIIVLPLTFFFWGVGLCSWRILDEFRLIAVAGNEAPLVWATYALVLMTFVLAIVTYVSARMQVRIPQQEHESRVHFVRGRLKTALVETANLLIPVTAALSSEIQNENDGKDRVTRILGYQLRELPTSDIHARYEMDETDKLNELIRSIIRKTSAMQNPPANGDKTAWYNERRLSALSDAQSAIDRCEDLQERVSELWRR